MSALSQLTAAGRRLDAARERFQSFAGAHADQRTALGEVREAFEAALIDYRTLLEDITGQHADVILRRLS